MQMTAKPIPQQDRQQMLDSEGPNQGEDFEWTEDPLPDDWKQYFLRKQCMAVAGAVCILLIAVIALIASNHTNEDAVAKNTIIPVPESFCKSPKEGELPGLSKEAFMYWTSVNPRPQHSQIIMLGDGYGPEIHSMARSVKRYMTGDMSLKLALDPHLVGTSITSSSSNIITDSAAGATAYSAAHKTYNGGIGVVPRSEEWNRKCADSLGGTRCPDDDPANPTPGRQCCKVDPVAHAFEGCRAHGMATGLVVTTVLPHATPASWSSHAMERHDLEFIAQQQLEHDPPIDVILGGGRALFDFHRTDGRDLLAEREDTHAIVRTKEEMRAEQARWEENDHAVLKPLVGLFADFDLQYELDREGYMGGREPSLREMVEVALSRLEATGKKYCLMVEGSHIDFALHANDAAAAAHEALAYDEAVQAVLSHATMLGRDDVSVVSVADHSTGGATLGMTRDWNITYGQRVCTSADESDDDQVVLEEASSCTASAGGYAYGTTDGWSPLVLANTRASIQGLAKKLCCEPQFRSDAALRKAAIEENLQIAVGADPERPWADIESEVDAAIHRLAPDFECMRDMHSSEHGVDAGVACTIPAEAALRRLQQFEARVGFTTNGHTSVDINVYAAGKDKMKFVGSKENSEVGAMLIESLGLDLAPITKALRDCEIPTFPLEKTPPAQ